ncbi:MAG: hypothetical protein DELT_03223 [Desulfovibrio sp.]
MPECRTLQEKIGLEGTEYMQGKIAQAILALPHRAKVA